jgi:hypothetical protein
VLIVDKIVNFPISPAERARRLQVEAERLARLPAAERMFWIDSAAEQHGIEAGKLKAMVEATVKEAAKKARQEKSEERQREQRAEKQRASASREQERQKRQQREQRRAQEQADNAAAKDAERKQRERDKEFAALLKLPSAEQEPRLIKLAERLGEDVDFLREEFAKLVADEEKTDVTSVEPWPELVDTRVLLTEVTAQLRRYVLMHDDDAVAVTLWICFAWLHHIAVHSPLLGFDSPEGDTGKTTACDVVGFLTPRAYAVTELTGPSLYRFVDHMRPTLIIDDADDLFLRRRDLKHIVNVGWTRGTKIPRQGPGGVTHWFDPFCPKVIAGANLYLPKTTYSRTIMIKLVPKLPHERVEDFHHDDDETFQTLRRKLARWAADNAAALKDAKPVLPPGSTNRLAQNWTMQLAIADLAGAIGRSGHVRQR